jgi:sugar phosphate isomerase/epimerase
MSDWPIGLSTGCFYRKSIFDVLDDIRNSGISIIEICSYPSHLDYHDLETVKKAAAKIRELELEPFSFHAPFAEDIDITSLEEEKRHRSLQEILKAAEAAAHLGVFHFVIHPGPESERKPPVEEHFRRLENAAEALNEVSKQCLSQGMTLILENMLPHHLFGNTSDLLWIMGSIEERNVGICLDTGHAHLSGDLYTITFKLSGHLKMIHAADNRGANDDHLPPGKGDIDWNKVIARLNEAGFHGTFILELSGDDNKSSLQLLKEARQARGFIREISQKIDFSNPL